MYCNQCGNIVPEGGAFCTFCGAKCEASTEKQSAPETAIVQATPAQPPKPIEETTPVSAPIAEVVEPVSEASMPVREASVPIPEAIPLEPVKKPGKAKQEKYYTRGHIVFCLIVNGILAIATGVFAGLYFTTVL